MHQLQVTRCIFCIAAMRITFEHIYIDIESDWYPLGDKRVDAPIGVLYLGTPWIGKLRASRIDSLDRLDSQYI
jgi:hypothetical protein